MAEKINDKKAAEKDIQVSLKTYFQRSLNCQQQQYNLLMIKIYNKTGQH